MDKLKYKARAKVNLGLDVCGRLPNGYHKVKMIMQAIDLYDELEFNKRKDPDIILSVDSKDPLGDIGNNLIFSCSKTDERVLFHQRRNRDSSKEAYSRSSRNGWRKYRCRCYHAGNE